ncbi:MAG: hypothetical protein JWN55_1474 [Frankiales bacterium]|nr:hypothetical protein [Frankiales bacterium]
MGMTQTWRPLVNCDNLVCAGCSGPVEEGRCSLCRAAREQLHAHRLPAGPVLLAAVVALLLLLLLL